MARSLTKTKADGGLYTRPPGVEAQIDVVVQLSLPDLRTRVLVRNRTALGYLRHECLVHLVREGRRAGDQELMSAVLPVLLSRCEANLLVTVPDGELPDAASIRQNILDDLTELFVMDGSDEAPSPLDFYECRFNMAFRALRIDAVRREVQRRNEIEIVDLPNANARDGPVVDEDLLARVSDAFKVPPKNESDDLRDARREICMRALKTLSP